MTHKISYFGLEIHAYTYKSLNINFLKNHGHQIKIKLHSYAEKLSLSEYNFCLILCC